MILTTGHIDDFQETIDILVEASTLPLSVIIIGIGKGDFSKMEEIDGDEKPIESSTGKVRKRDLVQFVPFEKYQNDNNLLFMEVLAEIPRQIMEYYQFKNLNPDKIKNIISQKNGAVITNQSNIINNSKQNQQYSINNNSMINNIVSINISQTVKSQNSQSINGSNQFIPNPFANNRNNIYIYNNSYYSNEIPYEYSQSNISNQFPASVPIPNILNQNQMYNSYINQPNLSIIPPNNYSNNYMTQGVNQFNNNYNINITNNNINNHISNNNITNNNINNHISNNNITNNNINNHISNNNITNNNESQNTSNNYENFNFDNLPTEKTIYISKRK